MMMVADQIQSAKLAGLTGWTCLYWWNLETPKTAGPDGKSGKPRWELGSKKTGVKSVPAYNFDFLFEKMRPVFLTQGDLELLDGFKVLLRSENPAGALCRLAIILAEKGLLK